MDEQADDQLSALRYRPVAAASVLLATILIVGSLHAPAIAQQKAAPEPRTLLSGSIELARLVDLCVQRLGVRVEYDATQLRETVTLRLDAAVTDQELWALTNRLLASRGYTSVRLPGEGNVLSIIKLTEAKDQARIEPPDGDRIDAGYVAVVVRLEHQPARTIVDALKSMLSAQTAAVGIGDRGLMLLTGLRPRIDEILDLIEQLDVPSEPPLIERIETRFVRATQLAALVQSVATSRDAVSDLKLRGKVTAVPDETAVILIAPPEEAEIWRGLIGRFDQRQAVETRSYTPAVFGIDEVRQLIEQTVRDPGPRGSSDQWRVVNDPLTGSLIITATPAEHEQIGALIDRLDSMPPEARRPMRAFPIRNRPVNEIRQVLMDLLDAGVLESDPPLGSITDQRIPGISRRRDAGFTSRTERGFTPGPGGAQIPQGDARAAAGLAPPTTPPRASPINRATSGASGGLLTLTADEGTNTLIAVGEPRVLAQVERLLETLDVRQPQVMIEVLVVSLSEGDSFDLGVELQKIELSGSTLIRLTSLFGLGGTGAIDAPPEPGPGFSGVVLNPGDFSVVIRALKTINQGRTTNLPRVLVNNNQTATLDSVLQQPLLSVNASDTVATTSFAGSSDAGTTVTVTPQIAEGDHLVLEYSVSISAFVGESSDPSLPPPKQQNRIDSHVTIPDGYTVVVGGLEITTEAEAESRVPILGDIPFIGEAFKSRSKSSMRSRFFVFIRADVLRHGGFEDLKYLSDREAMVAELDGEHTWPIVEPRIIR